MEQQALKSSLKRELLSEVWIQRDLAPQSSLKEFYSALNEEKAAKVDLHRLSGEYSNYVLKLFTVVDAEYVDVVS